MKTKLFVLLFALTLPLALSAQDPKKVETVVFEVNMHCENCKAKIEKNISWEKGVKDLTVNLKKKTVTIRFDPKKTTVEKLQAAIEALGYTAHKAPEATSPKKIAKNLIFP